MTEAETILKLIETADPADVSRLDEIDARVWCFLKSKVFSRVDGEAFWSDDIYIRYKDSFDIDGYEEYTRSRDSLKKIRPKGWIPNITAYPSFEPFGGLCEAVWEEHPRYHTKSQASTETLAELHAIIQAIEYERTQHDR